MQVQSVCGTVICPFTEDEITTTHHTWPNFLYKEIFMQFVNDVAKVYGPRK